MSQAIEELLRKYFDKRIEAGNFAHFAELTGDLALMGRHEGERSAYEEIVGDLTALLEKCTPGEET